MNAIYEIRNDDPRMEDFTEYEDDYGFKCTLIDQYIDDNVDSYYVDVWRIVGEEAAIIDFITDYGLELVAEKIEENAEEDTEEN